DPRTDLERYFVRSAVAASWRLDRVRRAEAAAGARRVIAAGAEADRKDALEVEHSLKYLGLWPEKYLRTLRGSARGCRAMLDRWRDLVAALEGAGCWLDSERRWAVALAGLEPHRWHEDAAVRRLVSLELVTQVAGCTPDEARTFVFEHLAHDEAAMKITPDEFEVRVEALLAGLPAPAAARAELLAWARASIVELEAHLDEVEEFERRDRELAVEEALFDGGPSGAARLRAELAQDRVLRTSLQELRRLQRERAEAADAGASDRAAGSADPAAPTEANLEAVVLCMTAEATASTEANAEAVEPVTQVDIAAPTGPNPEAPIPCETVVAVAPSEADAEQEVLFVTAAATASTGPDAGSEIARGGRRVFEAPAPGPTPWGLEGGGATPALRPDPVAPGAPDSGSQLLFALAVAAAPTGPDAEVSGPAAPTGPDAPEVVTAGSACGTVPIEPEDQRQLGGLGDPPEAGVQALLARPVGGGGDDQGPVGAGPISGSCGDLPVKPLTGCTT
ncbi:MAG: hypothetical protein JO252_12115, partial [Planctomycetaceae bacterium]|nr:hypothetical protein [Planctomycetaceae bacterium]